MLDGGKVEPLRGNVRGHQHVLATLLELSYGPLPFLLVCGGAWGEEEEEEEKEEEEDDDEEEEDEEEEDEEEEYEEE